MRVSTLLIVTMVTLGAIAIAHGVRGESAYLLIECRPGQECRPRGGLLPSPACDIDAASLAIVSPKGTRIRCARIDNLPDRKESRQ